MPRKKTGSVEFRSIRFSWAIPWTMARTFPCKTILMGHQMAHEKQFAILGDGTLMIGNQDVSHFLLWLFTTDESISNCREITEGITDISDLCFDPVRNALWIADSETNTINLCTLQGAIIASYSMSFIDNGEGLYVDRDRQCIWVSDDTTSNIYKITFSNL